MERDFSLTAPNRLWLADITYVPTWCGDPGHERPEERVAHRFHFGYVRPNAQLGCPRRWVWCGEHAWMYLVAAEPGRVRRNSGRWRSAGRVMNLQRIKVLAILGPLVGLLMFELARHYILQPATGEPAPHVAEHYVSGGMLFVGVMAFAFGVLTLIQRLHDRLLAVNQAAIAVTADMSVDLVLDRVAELARTVARASSASVRVDGQPPRSFTAGTTSPHGPTLSLPIVVKGHRLGELVLAGPRRKRFRDSDRSALEPFATQAGIALENARLFEQERELVAVRERARIGMDLHDGLIQELYGLGLKVEDATEVALEDPDAAVAWLGNVQVGLREAITEIRTYVYGLKETDRSVELRPVLEHLIAEFPAARPQVELWIERDARLPAAVAANVVHIVREAVANSLRHSGASRVGVRVASKDSRLVVAVGDDGTGFDPDAPAGGLGISHMHERARLCRSELTIVSSPGGGTNVVIALPSGMAPPGASADRS